MLWLCGEETGPRLAAEANSDVMLRLVWVVLPVEMAWQDGGGGATLPQAKGQASEAGKRGVMWQMVGGSPAGGTPNIMHSLYMQVPLPISQSGG
jgi:hypothetical protein